MMSWFQLTEGVKVRTESPSDQLIIPLVAGLMLMADSVVSRFMASEKAIEIAVPISRGVAPSMGDVPMMMGGKLSGAVVKLNW